MRKWMLAAAIGAAVVGGAAFAMVQRADRDELSRKELLGAQVDANTPAARAEARFEARLAAQTAREADVGDTDSFGRNVRWMGLVSSPLISLRESCELLPGEDPGRLCMEVTPNELGSRSAEFRDVARMTLPAGSTHSMLCHWLTPTVTANFANYSGFDDRFGRVLVGPSLTIENEVLDDPALVDPDTGEPLNGKVEIFASSAFVSTGLDNGQFVPQRLTSTRACIGGYVNKRSLVEIYGLSERQAEEFFRKPTTLRLNLSVLASLVQSGNVFMGIRFVGD